MTLGKVDPVESETLHRALGEIARDEKEIVCDVYNFKQKYCKVSRVIDGDTFVVLINYDGCKIEMHARLFNIDTPEKYGVGKVYGEYVKKCVEDLFNKYNYECVLDGVGKDMYGRVLVDNLKFVRDDQKQQDEEEDLIQFLLKNSLAKKTIGKKRPLWSDDDYKKIIKK